jgi:glycolate oxidase iron-sulfur subunit
MHCGMCLPTCPTYEKTGLEKYSPRGRIQLIKSVAEGELEITENFIDSIELCLNCQACVTSCPAGVEYGQLVEAAHYNIEEHLKRQNKVPLVKKVLLKWLFLKQYRLRAAAFFMLLYQKSGLEKLTQKLKLVKLISNKLYHLSFMTPKLTLRKPYTVHAKAKGKHKNLKIGIPTGCVQDAFFNNVNIDTIDVLQENGFNVFTPQQQVCCGSVHGHNGALETARQFARTMIDSFLSENVDYIGINSAGCGSFMKKYDQLLANDSAYASKAKDFVKRVKDVSEILTEFGEPVKGNPIRQTATYHEPCHLAHGQKIKEQPRKLIQSVPGLNFVEMPESDWCCGSAGIYNVVHYEESMHHLERKMLNIKRTGAELVVTGNPGCMIQLMYGTKKYETDVEIIHPVTLLKRSYQMGNSRIHSK